MWGTPATREANAAVESHLQSITERLAPIEDRLWMLAVATAILDVYLTYLGLQAGGLTEGNPLVASLLETAGIAALLALKAGLLGLAAAARWRRPVWGPWLSLGLALPWLTAVAVNATLLAAA